jgi:hypothetical protein
MSAREIKKVDGNIFKMSTQEIKNVANFLPSANIFLECRMKIFCQQTKK